MGWWHPKHTDRHTQAEAIRILDAMHKPGAPMARSAPEAQPKGSRPSEGGT